MAADRDQPFYVVDASGWISIDGSPDQNRILYFITKLIEAGRIISPPEVWDELEKCNGVLAWIGHDRKRIVKSFTNNADFLALLGDIAFRFPGMAAPRGKKNKADPYVVAAAAYKKSTSNHDYVVVAAETLAQRPKRKIPTACAHYKVECIGIVEMLEREFPEEGF